jgi:hypothetical protein
MRRFARIVPNHPTLFDHVESEKLAVAGLELAIESAERKVKDWKKLCWQLFLVWLRRRKKFEEFMIEDFRKYLYEYDLIEPPPSDRAFGFISRKGLKEGWIQWAGIRKVKNSKAHATPANVWMKKI